MADANTTPVDSTAPAPAPDSAAAAPAAVVERKAHPAATYVAALFGGSMSFRDQRWAHDVNRVVVYASAVVGYIAGWYVASFTITAYTVLAGTVFAALLTVPDWRQRADEDAAAVWLDAATVTAHYEQLDIVEVALAKRNKRKPLKHFS
jgi:hypothetical protein